LCLKNKTVSQSLSKLRNETFSQFAKSYYAKKMSQLLTFSLSYKAKSKTASHSLPKASKLKNYTVFQFAKSCYAPNMKQFLKFCQ
jgi:hypothetical protein